MYKTDERSEWANEFLEELGLDTMYLLLSLSMLMSSEETLTSIKWDIAKMLKKEFIFAISLLDATIQDGGMKKRSVFGLSRVNDTYMASNQNKFILSDLLITVFLV